MGWKILAVSVAILATAAFTSPVQAACDPDPLEIVFAIDISSSLYPANFSSLKDFLKSMADHLPIGPDKTRPAVVSYSTNVKVEVDLGAANDAQTFKKAVDGIPYYRGLTATGPAMQAARRTVFPKSRPGANKLLVVITDGASNLPGSMAQARDLVKAESAELRGQGVRVHAIGVGGKVPGEELEAIAGSNDFQTVSLYSELSLLVDTIVKKKKCDVECENLGKESFPGQCFQGTQRIVHVAHEQNKLLNRCEKSITYEFKYCGTAHLCKEVEVTVGDCVGGVREVVTSWEDFDVQEQKCVLRRSVQKMDCNAIQECRDPVAEIIYLLDSSASMSNPDWNLQMQFVNRMVSDMKVAPDAIRVGIIVFGNAAYNYIPLGSAPTKSDLLQRLARVNRRINENTNTGSAIQLAKSEFATRSRPDISRIAILMTDGESNMGPNAIQEAAKLESEGVTIIVIGVGKNLKKQELEAIATPPLADHLFYATDFNKLMNWAGKISQETCESITPPDPSLCDLPPKRVVSSCYKSLQKITEVRYEYDPQGRCTKKLLSHTTSPCKVICTDPINGNQYYDGETWKSECSSFLCRRPSSQTEVFVPNAQECPGADKKCFGVNSNENFRCHDERGRLYGQCNCLAEKGGALIRVITADGNAKP